VTPPRAVQASVYLPPELIDAIDDLARVEYRSRSDMIVVLLRDAVLDARVTRRRKRTA
jgi:metal-responsive CopG/Arc/MetJ family transcriptional regulator